jgi:hypothetical protein
MNPPGVRVREMEEVVAKKEDDCTIPEERRCTYVLPDGRRCKMRRRWGKEQCYHHDPEAAEQRKQAGRQVSRLRILTATEVQELVSRALEEVRAGKMPVGRAYAVGYLAQLLLGNLEAVREEYEAARTSWDRYEETLWRVRALDQGTYQARDAKEADEAEEGSDSRG